MTPLSWLVFWSVRFVTNLRYVTSVRYVTTAWYVKKGEARRYPKIYKKGGERIRSWAVGRRKETGVEEEVKREEEKEEKKEREERGERGKKEEERGGVVKCLKLKLRDSRDWRLSCPNCGMSMLRS